MKARVKKDARYGTIQALGSIEFTKIAWVKVPAGMEAEAERNEYLECQIVKPVIKVEKKEVKKVVKKADPVIKAVTKAQTVSKPKEKSPSKPNPGRKPKEGK